MEAFLNCGSVSSACAKSTQNYPAQWTTSLMRLVPTMIQSLLKPQFWGHIAYPNHNDTQCWDPFGAGVGDGFVRQKANQAIRSLGSV